MCWSASSVHVDFLCVSRGQLLPPPPPPTLFFLLNILLFPLASHADVAGLAAGILLGINCGETHQLVPADLCHCAQG